VKNEDQAGRWSRPRGLVKRGRRGETTPFDADLRPDYRRRGLRFPADPRSRLGAYDVFSATAFLTMWRVIGWGSLLKTGSSVYLAGS